MGPDDDDTSLYAPRTGDNVTVTPANLSTVGNANVSIVSHSADMKKVTFIHSSITKMKEPLDDTNWVVWRELIRRIFHLCGVEAYVYSNSRRPDPDTDPEAFKIWDAND